MKITLNGTVCTVTRESGDPRPHGVAQARGESILLHHIKKVLNDQGHDLIKKRMWRDGHLVDDCQQYLRARKSSGDSARDIYIYNARWAIEGAEADFNRSGTTTLTVVYGVFNQQR
jgi:hypothetical protein